MIFDSRADSEVIEIYAALSRRQYNEIQSGYAEIEIPSNIEMMNKSGSRSLYFSCYGKKAAKELVDGLDASSIAWQEVYLGEDVFGQDNSYVEDTEEDVENKQT